MGGEVSCWWSEDFLLSVEVGLALAWGPGPAAPVPAEACCPHFP